MQKTTLPIYKISQTSAILFQLIVKNVVGYIEAIYYVSITELNRLNIISFWVYRICRIQYIWWETATVVMFFHGWFVLLVVITSRTIKMNFQIIFFFVPHWSYYRDPSIGNISFASAIAFTWCETTLINSLLHLPFAWSEPHSERSITSLRFFLDSMLLWVVLIWFHEFSRLHSETK